MPERHRALRYRSIAIDKADTTHCAADDGSLPHNLNARLKLPVAMPSLRTASKNGIIFANRSGAATPALCRNRATSDA
jgi:hypothetical protein